MVKKSVKEMLIDIYKEEREQTRCDMVQGLQADATLITETLYNEIKERGKSIDSYNIKAQVERNSIKECNKNIETLLKENKLLHFTDKVCGGLLHPTLKTFDTETKEHIKKILVSKNGVV